MDSERLDIAEDIAESIVRLVLASEDKEASYDLKESLDQLPKSAPRLEQTSNAFEEAKEKGLTDKQILAGFGGKKAKEMMLSGNSGGSEDSDISEASGEGGDSPMELIVEAVTGINENTAAILAGLESGDFGGGEDEGLLENLSDKFGGMFAGLGRTLTGAIRSIGSGIARLGGGAVSMAGRGVSMAGRGALSMMPSGMAATMGASVAGSSALAIGGTVLGGLAAGMAIGDQFNTSVEEGGSGNLRDWWRNSRLLGLRKQSIAERESEEQINASGDAAARARGYSSFAEMQAANDARRAAQSQNQEMLGEVINTPRINTSESLREETEYMAEGHRIASTEELAAGLGLNYAPNNTTNIVNNAGSSQTATIQTRDTHNSYRRYQDKRQNRVY